MRSVVKWGEVGKRELQVSQILRDLLALVRSFHFAPKGMGKRKDLHEELSDSAVCLKKVTLATV